MSFSVKKTYKNFTEVSTDTRGLSREKQDKIVQATRDPVSTDRFGIGTIWINTSSTNVFIRFPVPNSWRKITTAAP